MLSSKIYWTIGMTLCAISGASLGRAQCEAWTPLGDGPRIGINEIIFWDRDGDGPATTELTVVGGHAYSNATLKFIARWDGETWQQVGENLTGGGLNAVELWDPDGAGPLEARLVIGGYFYSPIDGISLANVAEWDGTTWQPLGNGPDLTVNALTTWDPDGDGPAVDLLVAGGVFSHAGGAPANSIAAWNGTTWQELGSGVSSDGPYPTSVSCLTTWDPDGDGPLGIQLIAGGGFTSAGGVAAKHVARWDGSTWHALGGGCSGNVFSLTTWDPDGPGPVSPQLAVGGSFASAGGAPAAGVALWDGEQWRSLATDQPLWGVTGLSTWDPDGPGPLATQLAAAGPAVSADEADPFAVALWDGITWRTVGPNMSGNVHALASWEVDGAGASAPRLLAAGIFKYAGNTVVNGVAAWTPCPPPCAGDIDCDGFVTLADIDPFVAHIGCPGPDPATCNTDCAWQNGDLNGDGHVTFADIDPFVARLGAACE